MAQRGVARQDKAECFQYRLCLPLCGCRMGVAVATQCGYVFAIVRFGESGIARKGVSSIHRAMSRLPVIPVYAA
jgi:hypothetical protein